MDTEPTHSNSIDVAVAVLRAQDGRVLLCRRPDDARYGGMWEFPGGKLDPGESHLDALRRELREELAIACESAEEIGALETRYDDGGTFAVRFFLVERWMGEPVNLAASELVWSTVEDLESYEILEGSRVVRGLLMARFGSDETTGRLSSPT